MTGFLAGLAHPVGGLDHALAMVALGIWAAQMPRRAVVTLPLAFLAAMVLGGALGAAGVALPWAEAAIVGSVVAFGAFVALRVRPPLWAAVVLTAAFAVCHGYAHGAEMPANVFPIGYAAGFVVATAVLHLFGIALARVAMRAAGPTLVRLEGVAVAAGGVFLIL